MDGYYSHDHGEMNWVASSGSWDMFAFTKEHPCFACMAPFGALYVLARHRELDHTFATPCVQNGARIELRAADGASYAFDHIDDFFLFGPRVFETDLPLRGVLIASVRWFVDHPESRARQQLLDELGLREGLRVLRDGRANRP